MKGFLKQSSKSTIYKKINKLKTKKQVFKMISCSLGKAFITHIFHYKIKYIKGFKNQQ